MKELDCSLEEKVGDYVREVYSPDKNFYRTAFEGYKAFLKEVNLALTDKQKKHLAAQTVQGHAINGHQEFRDIRGEVIRYPNATIDDVYKAILSYSSEFGKNGDVKKERDGLVREIRNWNKSTIHNKGEYSPRRLQDKNGEPLMGIDLFSHTTIEDPKNVHIGEYLGGALDSDEWREFTEQYLRENFEEYRDFKIHKGFTTAGNIEKIRNAGLTIEDLANKNAYEDKGYNAERLKEEGLIVDFENEEDNSIFKQNKKGQRLAVRNNYPYVPVYVETNKGYGVSDDAAFIYLSLRYGLEAGFGLILADAVDTIDKHLSDIREKGEDEAIGEEVPKEYNKNKVGKTFEVENEEIAKMILASSTDPQNPGKWPSCSQRRFFQIENGNYPLLNHVDLIKHIKHEGPAPDEMKLSFKGVSSNKFYPNFGDRIRDMLRSGLIEGELFEKCAQLDYVKNGNWH